MLMECRLGTDATLLLTAHVTCGEGTSYTDLFHRHTHTHQQQQVWHELELTMVDVFSRVMLRYMSRSDACMP